MYMYVGVHTRFKCMLLLIVMHKLPVSLRHIPGIWWGEFLRQSHCTEKWQRWTSRWNLDTLSCRRPAATTRDFLSTTKRRRHPAKTSCTASVIYCRKHSSRQRHRDQLVHDIVNAVRCIKKSCVQFRYDSMLQSCIIIICTRCGKFSVPLFVHTNIALHHDS